MLQQAWHNRGTAVASKDQSNREIYNVNLKDENGFLVRKLYLPEL